MSFISNRSDVGFTKLYDAVYNFAEFSAGGRNLFFFVVSSELLFEMQCTVRRSV